MSAEFVCMLCVYLAAGALLSAIVFRNEDLWHEPVQQHGALIVIAVFALLLIWPLTAVAMACMVPCHRSGSWGER